MLLDRIARALPEMDVVLARPEGASLPEGTGFARHVQIERPQPFARERRLPGKRRLASYADVLERFGFADAGFVEARVRLWGRVLDEVRPDAVVADYAPALLLASNGRVPRLAVGNGYTLPPAALERFPLWFEGVATVDAAAMLENADRGARAAGGTGVAHLPAAFEAERGLCMTLPALDPFGKVARRDVCGVASGDHRATGKGEAVFAYLSDYGTKQAGPVLDALRRLGRPATVVASKLRPGRAGNVEVKTTFVSHAQIAEGAVLLVHGGGHDMMAFGALAGLPQVCFVRDLEKFVHATLLARTGVCETLAEPDAGKLEAAMRQALAKADAARKAATGLERWRQADPIGLAAAAVREMTG